jgi:hypothetical protein
MYDCRRHIQDLAAYHTKQERHVTPRFVNPILDLLIPKDEIDQITNHKIIDTRRLWPATCTDGKAAALRAHNMY